MPRKLPDPPSFPDPSAASNPRLVPKLEERLRCPRCKEDVVLVLRIPRPIVVLTGVLVHLHEAPREPLPGEAELLEPGRRLLRDALRIRLLAKTPARGAGRHPTVHRRIACPRCNGRTIVRVRIERSLAKTIYDIRHARHPRRLGAPAADRAARGARYLGALLQMRLRRPTRAEASA